MPDIEKITVARLTTGSVARIFKVHPGTVRRWCEQGKLKSYRSGPRGPRWFLRMDVTAAYLDKSMQEYLQDYCNLSSIN
jgi:excisionase family DNA binding protein